jgi:hypothetical protein
MNSGVPVLTGAGVPENALRLGQETNEEKVLCCYGSFVSWFWSGGTVKETLIYFAATHAE